MNRARWDRARQQQEAEMPAIARELALIESENLPHRKGDPLGCLQWHDFRTGQVRRWVIRIGDRSDRITVEAPGRPASQSHGWAWLTTKLRKAICNRMGGTR